MNFKVDETPTKLRGGYYTDPDIASLLLKWVLNIHPKSILEPSCGDGVFLRGLLKLSTNGLKSIKAFEIEPVEAGKAKQVASELKKVDIEVQNAIFLVGHFLNY